MVRVHILLIYLYLLKKIFCRINTKTEINLIILRFVFVMVNADITNQSAINNQSANQAWPSITCMLFFYDYKNNKMNKNLKKQIIFLIDIIHLQQ